MKTLNIIFIIFSLVIVGCIKKSNEIRDDFFNYLEELNVKPKDNCAYLFIPSTQCTGCINLNAGKLSEHQNENIYIFSNIARSHFRNFKNYVYDKEDKITSLRFVNFENKLLFFSKGEVVFCSPVSINWLLRNKKCESK